MIQIAVPSRVGIPSYERYREQVEELVSRINGEMGRVGWTPIEYLYQSVSPAQLASLYRAADVMLVTPLRDGMNLVAKEYVAARTDHDGVLVLSEFAGSAHELPEALTINPYAIDEMADAFARALTMSAAERRQRMEGLRRTVLARDVRWWASTFMRDLAYSTRSRPLPEITHLPETVTAGPDTDTWRTLGRPMASPCSTRSVVSSFAR